MKTFRKIGGILLALLMLSATTGGHFYAHHCNSMQRTTFLWKNTDGGCCHGSCTLVPENRENHPEVRLEARSCCETESIFIHWEPQVQIPAGPMIQPPVEMENDMAVDLQELLHRDAKTRISSARQFTPPPLSGRDRVFFIHQPKIPSPATV